MEFGSQAAPHDAAFSNISATPEACEQRQALFLRFLNEFQSRGDGDDLVSSQGSGTPVGSQVGRYVYVEQLSTMKEREIETLYVSYQHLVEFNAVRGMVDSFSMLRCCQWLIVF
jgi:hypothetical protein